MRDYEAWHEEYGRPGSGLQRRLVVVQDLIGHALDVLPPGDVQVVSVCAGQAHDLAGVVAHHPRGADLTGTLLELDERNAAQARARLRAAGDDDRLEVRTADAGVEESYRDLDGLQLVVACGVFGNVATDDVGTFARFVAGRCAPGAHLVWTRFPEPPELLDEVDSLLEIAGFAPDQRVVPHDRAFGAGSAVLRHRMPATRSTERVFTFLR